LRSCGKAAKLTKPISFHKVRHSFAVLAIREGVDIFTLSKLLGHSDVAVTQIYGKVGDQAKRKAVDMLQELK
jgi:site-specific recombinase XerD